MEEKREFHTYAWKKPQFDIFYIYFNNINMIHYSRNKSELKDIVFSRHKNINCDEINFLCGYVGTNELEEFAGIIRETNNIKVNFIYGMKTQSNSQKSEVSTKHEKILELDKSMKNFSIFYPSSQYMSHSKIYIWKYKNEIQNAMIGSANFSETLTIPYRETLMDIPKEGWKSLLIYYNEIYNNSRHSTDILDINFDNKPYFPYFTYENNKLQEKKDLSLSTNIFDETLDSISLYEYESRSIYDAKDKINWGHQSGNHDVGRRAGNIPLPFTKDLPKYLKMFPPKFRDKGLGYADNDPVKIEWDDKEIMTGILSGTRYAKFSGTQKEGGLRHPNCITTYGTTTIMGDYLRQRMGLEPGIFVTERMLKDYGRDTITIKLISPGHYFMDFSSPKMK